MTLQDVANRGSQLGFRVVNDQILAVFRGYPVTITSVEKNGKNTVSCSFALGRQVSNKISKVLRSTLPEKARPNYSVAGMLIVSGTTESNETFNYLAAILNAVTSALSGSDKPVYPPENCGMCNKPNYDSFSVVAGRFVPVHRECVSSRNQAEIAKAQKNEESGNYLLGIIGAILGAIVGCLPNLLLIIFAQYQFSLLYMIIPFASYKGYTLFGGKKGGVARLVVIVASLAAFCLTIPSAYHFLAKKEFGLFYGLAYFEGIKFWIDAIFADFSTYFFEDNIWFAAVSFVVGIFVSLAAIGVTNTAILQNTTSALDSLTNLDGTAYRPSAPTYEQYAAPEAYAPEYAAPEYSAPETTTTTENKWKID